MKNAGFSKKQIVVWIAAVVVFLSHQVLQFISHLPVTFIDNYLDPYLFPIITLPMVLSEHRYILDANTYVFPMVVFIGYTLMLIIVSEVIFPFLSTRFTADGLDVIAIIMGSINFYIVYNLRRQEEPAEF